VIGHPGSLDALRSLARRVEVVTLDHELVSIAHLRALERDGVRLAPGPEAAGMAVDKLAARTRFRAEGFAVPDFAEVAGASEIIDFGDVSGWPIIVKSTRGGYDGRGVMVVASPAEAESAAARLAPGMIAEAHVEFDQEIAVLVARRRGGETAVYPPVSTVQRDGMCAEVICPATVSTEVARAASDLARRLAERLGLVGVMAVELFVVGSDLLVNEVATRPHNTAHHTIEANETSQFEQHLRAILDLPLGSTASRSPAAAMSNIVGGAGGDDPSENLAAALAIPGAHLHLYGKQARYGRKLGHITALGSSVEDALATARLAAGHLGGIRATAGLAS
jgi:5-(carboxyamino)imidazole ribonucleotide synthase